LQCVEHNGHLFLFDENALPRDQFAKKKEELIIMHRVVHFALKSSIFVTLRVLDVIILSTELHINKFYLDLLLYYTIRNSD